MNAIRFLRNAELLGTGPGRDFSFHDAEVLAMRLDRDGPNSPVLEMDVHVFKVSDQIAEDGSFVRNGDRWVRLRFSAVELERLEGFNEQNVLFDVSIQEIEVRRTGKSRLAVELEASYGVSASFACADAEVVSVAPYESSRGSKEGT